MTMPQAAGKKARHGNHETGNFFKGCGSMLVSQETNHTGRHFGLLIRDGIWPIRSIWVKQSSLDYEAPRYQRQLCAQIQREYNGNTGERALSKRLTMVLDSYQA